MKEDNERMEGQGRGQVERGRQGKEEKVQDRLYLSSLITLTRSSDKSLGGLWCHLAGVLQHLGGAQRPCPEPDFRWHTH